MRRKTIEDLPNELLAHIFQYINNPRSKYLPVKSNRFRAIVSMTSVSRRFRTIALLFAQQDLVFNYVDELEYTSSVIIDKRGSDAELKPGEEKGGRFHWIFHTRYARSLLLRGLADCPPFRVGKVYSGGMRTLPLAIP